MNKFKPLLLFNILLITACAGFYRGDVFLSAKGNIQGTGTKTNTECKLILLSNGKTKKEVKVSGKFDYPFWVPPVKATYVVRLRCNDKIVGEIEVDISKQRIIDFGEIRL